jgi:hypothetical protein
MCLHALHVCMLLDVYVQAWVDAQMYTWVCYIHTYWGLGTYMCEAQGTPFWVREDEGGANTSNMVLYGLRVMFSFYSLYVIFSYLLRLGSWLG